MGSNINVQSSEFPLIREKRVIYVDKTDYFYRIIRAGDAASNIFFLARPRRFGKSLMISTLKAIFQGKRELFEGLAIAKTDYDWQSWPVLHFDMSKAVGQTLEAFEERFNETVNTELRGHPGYIDGGSARSNLSSVLGAYERADKQVVILIDEYDAPFCETLNNPELCERIRGELECFYLPLKACQAAIHFAMLTGASFFSSRSAYSGLNNLIDLSGNSDYATMLGYTQAELEANFGEHLDRRAQEMGLSKADFMAGLAHWFNGYRFSRDSEERVYNPAAIARALASTEADFEALGKTMDRPAILSTFQRRNELLEEDFRNPIHALRYDFMMPSQLTSLSPIFVLYQTGYLTMKGYDAAYDSYILGIPNEEIRRDLNAFLCELASPDDARLSRL